VENGRFVPGSAKMASLCAIYGLEIGELQALYGIDPTDIRMERPIYGPPKTHLVSMSEKAADGAAPAMDTAKRPVIAETNLLTRLIDRWGDLPVPLLRKLALKKSVYGFIGTEDFTMSPLLPPGTFVQIDLRQNYIRRGPFPQGASQNFSRPIYFLDIRTGYACGWCELQGDKLTLLPHPDSGERTRTFKYPSEVTIVGRVTGVAMRIEEEKSPRSKDWKKLPRR
jgi:hypothetical protein